MTWVEAQTYCRQRYTDLVVIDSTQDVNRIMDKMNENYFFSFWIGLYEDVFTWRWSLSDESYYEDAEAEFRNWAAGEPKDQTSVPHCVGIRDTGEWQDLDCGLLHYFCCYDGNNTAKTIFFKNKLFQICALGSFLYNIYINGSNCKLLYNP